MVHESQEADRTFRFVEWSHKHSDMESDLMRVSTRFTRPCNACGRNLEIPVVLIGKEVACSHCGSHFVAFLPNKSGGNDDQEELDARIDRLLAVHPPHESKQKQLLSVYPAVSDSCSYEV
jgi:hypothetical protein